MNVKEWYIKFAKYSLEKIQAKNVIVNEGNTKPKLGEIIISPFLFLKSKNILNALNFKNYDCIVCFEEPIIDVLTGFEKDKNEKPSYNTMLLGFNNTKLMQKYYSDNMTDEELYEYCKNNNLKVKTLFSNIMVLEKMKLFGVLYIPEKVREEKINDIINFFNNARD